MDKNFNDFKSKLSKTDAIDRFDYLFEIVEQCNPLYFERFVEKYIASKNDDKIAFLEIQHRLKKIYGLQADLMLTYKTTKNDYFSSKDKVRAKSKDYTSDEAALELGISRRTFDKHVIAKKIKYSTVSTGKKNEYKRFSYEDLENFKKNSKK